MKITVQAPGASLKTDGFILPFWPPEGEKKKSKNATGTKSKSGARPALPAWASATLSPDEFSAAAGQTALVRLPPPLMGKNGAPHARCVLLLGLGPAQRASLHSAVGAYASAFHALKGARCATLALSLPASRLWPLPEMAGRLGAQLVMADYAFDKYKPKDDEGAARPEVNQVTMLCPAAALTASRASVSRGVLIGQAANLARALQNEPANVATPAYVAKKAGEMARHSGLSCTVLGPSRMRAQKMNAMLAVAAGSKNEPRLVVLQYRGNPQKRGWDAALVGKGVTFDSGGISIKPSPKMDEMKFDKSGACAVIGALSACRPLGLHLNVVGIAALVENMPSGSAYKPGDILAACNGTTMEILNTDAEGRVVLADALAYASKHYRPAALVDLATLTGACVVALGDLASGLLTENDALAKQLIVSGEKSGERLWRLPLWPEYDEKVKSEVAAVKNIGEPGCAGATAGASFLKPFVGDAPWAHLDIAGTAYSSKPRAGLSPGGTGVGVRLLLEYLANYKPAGKKGKK